MTTLMTNDNSNSAAMALMIDLNARGIQLQADGDELKVAPRAKLTSSDRATLKEQKAALVALLRLDPLAEAADAPTHAKEPVKAAEDPDTGFLHWLEHFAEEPYTIMHRPGPSAPIIVTARTTRSLVAKIGKTTWYGYGPLAPIDEGWEALPTVDAFLANEDVSDRLFPLPEDEDDTGQLSHRRSLWSQAQEVARRLGWEGGFREPPRVMSLPAPGAVIRLRPGFVFKQDANGSTFVISPAPMPWLTR